MEDKVDRDKMLCSLADALQGATAHSIQMAAQIDALEAVVIALGAKLGIDPEALESQLRRIHQTAHQKRLEAFEGRAGGAAALLDNRPEAVEFDEELLEMMRLGPLYRDESSEESE